MKNKGSHEPTTFSIAFHLLFNRCVNYLILNIQISLPPMFFPKSWFFENELPMMTSEPSSSMSISYPYSASVPPYVLSHLRLPSSSTSITQTSTAPLKPLIVFLIVCIQRLRIHHLEFNCRVCYIFFLSPYVFCQNDVTVWTALSPRNPITIVLLYIYGCCVTDYQEIAIRCLHDSILHLGRTTECLLNTKVLRSLLTLQTIYLIHRLYGTCLR